MSTIISPLPPLLDDPEHPFVLPGARWWRLKLRPNADGITMVQRRNEDRTVAFWDFFDGHDVIIDTGFDRPTKARIGYHEPEPDRGAEVLGTLSFTPQQHLDVLSIAPPTPNPCWESISEDNNHPDDESELTEYGMDARR